MKKTISLLLALAILLSFCACGKAKKQETYDAWPTSGLGAKLPVADTEKVKVYDYSSFLSIDIKDASAEDFSDYISKCEAAGFTIEAERDNEKYTAYNADGYKLEIHFFNFLKQISLRLDESKVNGTIEWPSIGLAVLLPTPDSQVGTIQSNSSTNFAAYVGEVSEEDYKNYVNQCIAMGFSVDFEDTGKSFSASNADGVELELSYQGFDTMYVAIKAPNGYTANEGENASSEAESIEDGGSEETTAATEAVEATETIEPTEEPETTEPTEATKADSTSIRADFKAAMDSYEAFMEEYVAFMKKYNESDGSDLSLLTEYAELMGEYADFLEEIEKWENEDLTDAELKYYMEVLERVTKKLNEIP